MAHRRICCSRCTWCVNKRATIRKTEGIHGDLNRAAAVAAVWTTKDDPETQAYVQPENIDRMHKIIVETDSVDALVSAEASLRAAGVGCKLWVEQPENFPTALASKPARRSVLKPHFAAFKLMR